MPHRSAELTLLGSVFPLIAVVCDSVWAFVAGTAREWLASHGFPARRAGRLANDLGTALRNEPGRERVVDG